MLSNEANACLTVNHPPDVVSQSAGHNKLREAATCDEPQGRAPWSLPFICSNRFVTLLMCCSFVGLLGINIPPSINKEMTTTRKAGAGELLAHAPTARSESMCNMSLVERPEAIEVLWSDEEALHRGAPTYNTTLHRQAVTNSVNPRFFGHKSACLPSPRGNKAGAWMLPRKVWISQPCDAAGAVPRVTGTQKGLAMCGCDTRVASLENVVWATEDAHNRYDIMSLAMVQKTNPLTQAVEWFAIDRSNLNLGKSRCVGDFPTNAANFQRLINNITKYCSRRPEIGSKARQDFDKVFFALGTILVPQAHRLESLLTAAVHYFASGLHLRRVPWALPKLLSKASQGVVETYLELTTLLDIAVVYYDEGAVQFAKRVHFFEDEHGDNFMCFKPFLKNYLWPRVLEIAKEKQFPVYENISFLKQKGSQEAGVFTPSRGFAVSATFLNFTIHTLHMPILNVLPLAEKMYYVNTASNILTSWGGPASFVFLLMMPRPVRVVLLVHKRYAREAWGTRINFKQRRGLSRVFDGAIARSKGLMYDFEHVGFQARFVHTRNLETLMFDNLFEAIMTPSFALGPSPW